MQIQHRDILSSENYTMHCNVVGKLARCVQPGCVGARDLGKVPGCLHPEYIQQGCGTWTQTRVSSGGRAEETPHHNTESDINTAMADKQTNVSTIVRDDFFNDPFFKDWWADFDLPMRNVQFSRQISGINESVLKVNQLGNHECTKTA